MADKQISALTAVSTHTDDDLFVVQQSSTAKKTTMGAIKSFIYNIANILSTASSISDANYFLVSQSGTPKKVTASTIKSYCGGGGGGSIGAFYALYGTHTLSQVITAYNSGYALWCKYGAHCAPLVSVDESMSTITSFTFYDVINNDYYSLVSGGWGTTSA